MDLDQFGSSKIYTWTKQHLLDVLLKGPKKIINDPLLANAFKNIDRKDFVPEEHQHAAYEDRPLPIGLDQTISQPLVVAQMLNYLHPREEKQYLDIGSGSGYVAALLGYVAGDNGKVYSLERNQYLADFARNNISKYPNLINRVEVVFKDGSKGLSMKAPFDFIHSAAAFDKIPNELKNQLAVGGRLVAPTKNNDIKIIERISPTDFDERTIDGYVFVPIVEGIE